MKDKDRIRKLYTIRYDALERVKAYLEQMAENGWMFEDYTGYWMQFRRCEPKKLNFAVEVFDKSSMYDTFCNEENLEYIEYCERAGWKHILSYGNLQFFYSEDPKLTPIETDASMKLRTVWRSVKSSTLLVNAVFPIIGIINLAFNFLTKPLLIFYSFTMMSMMVLWNVVILVNIFQAMQTLLWKKKCERSIACGEGFLPRKALSTRKNYVLVSIFFGVWSLLGIWAKFVWKDPFSLWIAGACMLVILVTLVLAGMQEHLRWKHVSAAKNVILPAAVSLTLLFGFVAVLVWFTVERMEFDDGLLLYVEEKNGEAFVVTQTEGFSPEEEYDMVNMWDSRFLLTYRDGLQRPLEAGEASRLELRMHYVYYHTSLRFLHAFLLDSAKQEKNVFQGLSYDFGNAGEPEVQTFSDGKMQVYRIEKEHGLYPYEYLFVGTRGILKIELNRPLSESSYEKLYEKVK